MPHQSLGWVLTGLLLIAACLQSNESLAQATETEQLKVKSSFSPSIDDEKGEVLMENSVTELNLPLSDNSDSASGKTEIKLTQTPPITDESITDEPFLRRVPLDDEKALPPRQFLESASEPYKASPGATIMTPSAYGASWGKIGIGVGYQDRTRFTDNNDGVIGLAFGLGDAQKYVGLEVGIGITDVSSPFNDGKLSLKFHRQLPANFNIALGVQGIGDWGDTDGGSSVYGVVSKRIVIHEITSQPFSEIYLSLGVGGGQFRSQSDIDNGVNSVGVFGSIAVRVIEPISLITEWTGQDLTLGLSIVPFRNLPFVIVPAITDVTHTAGDGTRFILGASYRFSF